MKKALMVKQPYTLEDPRWLELHVQAGDVMAEMLRAAGFELEVADSLERIARADDLATFDLIVPVWEIGIITPEELRPFLQAVESGTGVGGVHGTMADTFRDCLQYHSVVGGQFVGHGPGDETFRVHIESEASPITEGLRDFDLTSENYHLHVDPGNRVLATTRSEGVLMPVTWTRTHGKGRVFYCSAGHDRTVFDIPEVYAMVSRGLQWAAGIDDPVS